MGWATKQTPASKRTGYYYNGQEIALVGVPGFTGKRLTHNQKSGWYPENKKVEAAALWAVIKNVVQTANLTGIPPARIKAWMSEPWWQNVVDNVKKEQNDVLDAKMTEVLDAAIDLIKDRITGGEYYLDRAATREAGEPVYHRIPLRAKDATIAVDTLFDKRQLLRGEATTRTETLSESDKLKKLQENFQRLAQSKGINPEGEVIEHEETYQLVATPEDGPGVAEGLEDGLSDDSFRVGGGGSDQRRVDEGSSEPSDV